MKINRWRKIASLVPVCPFLGLGIKFLNLKVLLPVPLILSHFLHHFWQDVFSQGGGFRNKFAVPGRHKKNKSDLLNIARNEHKQPEGEGDLVNYALRWEERGEEPNTEFKEGSRSTSHSDSNWLKRKDDRMKQITNRKSGQMPKRMEQHNHNMNHMMKKDTLKKVENALRKRKTSTAKIPLLMGLGLPVLAKRFLNSFQVIITFPAIYNGTVSVTLTW